MSIFISLRSSISAVTEPFLVAAYRFAVADMPADLRNRIAIHEAGHVVAAWHSPVVTVFHRATVEPNGTGGASYEGRPLTDAVTIWEVAVIRMAGMAAELTRLGKVSSAGCGPDIENGAALIRELGAHGPGSAAPWGVGYRAASTGAPIPWPRGHSMEARAALEIAFRRATDVLSMHVGELDVVSAHLRRNGVVTGRMLTNLLGRRDRSR